MSTPSFQLHNKHAVITGASSGLGAEIAKALCSVNCNVLLIARREDKLQEQQLVLNHEYPSCNVKYLSCDLVKCDDWKIFAQTIYHMFPKIDIIFNVAGLNKRQPWQEIDIEDWNQTVDINLKAPFFLSREFVPQMQQNGWGRIINIASLQSVRAFDNSVPYGASKGGVVQLTRAMAQAWSRYGIAVNAIAPGFFPTELTVPVFNDKEKSKKLAEQTSYKRNGELKDIHGLSIFLASSASDYITGQTIFLDGGFTAS